ncbi:MAG: hypothetical protein AB1568_06460 [Thermodesulfobacteriota bacterium]
MRSRLALLAILVTVFVLVIRENRLQRPERPLLTTAGHVEMCLTCHRDEKLDAAHDREVLGCSPCHLGDALAIDKTEAHAGMVKNPGDLRLVEKTCAASGCHSRDVHKVKNSLMATNRGILATLLYYWGEAPDQYGDFSVEDLLATGRTSLAIDYFRKMCGTCHLWKQKGDLPGFFGEKGGGCTACHSVAPPPDPASPPPPAAAGEAPKKPHQLIIKKVPPENCIRCHNRSGRIGLSYTGRFEAEGYGTPYEKGGVSPKQLPGDRFYLDLPPDIHYEKNMACIDCHTRDEIMGDGTRHAHYEEQLEVQCVSCHGKTEPGTTRKGNKLNNIVRADGTFQLTGKLDDRLHPLAPYKEGVCDDALHRRLSCEACHSAWVPQCYGCHARRDLSETDRDKLTGEETPGWWSEGRSFIRYEKPMLALWADEVVVVTPGCQDMVTILDDKGRGERQFNRLTFAAINPHTTRKEARSCRDCHLSTKTLGLGEGTAWLENGGWRFSPLHQGERTPVGTTPPLDGYVTIDGVALQHGSRADLRPFSGDELARILRAGLCLPCHATYADPAWRTYGRDAFCPAPAGAEALRQAGLAPQPATQD